MTKQLDKRFLDVSPSGKSLLSDVIAPPISALEVLAYLTQIARGDTGDFIDDHGRITLAGGNSGLVKHYKKRGNTTAIELYSSLDALIMLAKYHKLIACYQRSHVKGVIGDIIIAESDYN